MFDSLIRECVCDVLYYVEFYGCEDSIFDFFWFWL